VALIMGCASKSSSTAGGGNSDAPGKETSKACTTEVADTPTPLFGEKVLIRPPVNVELVEDNPTFATTFASAGFVSACDATVDRMSIFVFQSDPKKAIGTYMDEVIDDMLTKSGFKGGTPGEPVVDTETDVHKAVEYAAADGQPPAMLYIAVTRKFDNVFVVVYQTRPDEFSALEPTFKASAESLLVIPPDA
jgi:hypothetical protein